MRGLSSLVTLALLISFSSQAFAQLKGTQQEQRACRGDVAKFCRDGMQDEAAILACLQQNREKLSKACQDVLKANGK